MTVGGRSRSFSSLRTSLSRTLLKQNIQNNALSLDSL